jgi:hypothetical protein
VIDPITESTGAGRTITTSSTATSGTSFAAALTAAEKKGGRVPARELKPPKGERWEPVPGHESDYAEIVSGKRNGYFVNLKPGPRQGDEFLIVKRQGRTFHVYGEGKTRHVVEVRTSIDPSKFKPRDGETWNKVGAHRDFKEIDGGERDGLHVNLSGNERTGKTFKLVRRGDRILHVYGEGENRRVIEVGHRHRADDAPPTDKTGAPDAGTPDPGKGEKTST